jgi:hypothetical protein
MTAPFAPVLPSAAAATAPAVGPSRWALWTGRGISGLVALFLAMGCASSFLAPPEVVEGTRQMGFSEAAILPFGVIQLVCLALYLVPRTAVLGAVLWTGYFGGAVATHVRLGDPLFAQVLVPVYVAALLWLGLYLRDARVRALAPWRR